MSRDDSSEVMVLTVEQIKGRIRGFFRKYRNFVWISNLPKGNTIACAIHQSVIGTEQCMPVPAEPDDDA